MIQLYFINDIIIAQLYQWYNYINDTLISMIQLYQKYNYILKESAILPQEKKKPTSQHTAQRTPFWRKPVHVALDISHTLRAKEHNKHELHYCHSYDTR
jgi:hypothetical protein